MIELRAGCCVRAVVYPARDKRGRGAKTLRTSDWQERLNIKHAAQKLMLILACNFTLSDWVVELTYDDDHLPPNAEGAVKRLKKFIRQLREGRKSRGVLLKYVYVTEGLHGDHRLHHHIVVNRKVGDFELFHNLWPDGRLHIHRLEKWGYSGAAAYLTKEPRKLGRVHVGDRMWTPSCNLTKPTVTVRDVPDNYSPEIPEHAYGVERAVSDNNWGHTETLDYMLPWKYSVSAND